MNRPRSVRSLGVVSFSAAPTPADSSWPGTREGVETAALVALDAAFTAARVLGSAEACEVEALVDQDSKGPLGFSVPPDEPEVKAAIERGREGAFDVILSGRVEPGPDPKLALTLIDTERRRVFERTRIDDPDPGRWGARAAAWVCDVLGIESPRELPPESDSLEDALDVLDARVSMHAYDRGASPSDLDRSRRCAVAAVRRRPDDQDRAKLFFWSLYRGSSPPTELLAEIVELIPKLDELTRVHLFSLLRRWCPNDQVFGWTGEALADPRSDQLRWRLRLQILIEEGREEEVEREARAALEAHPQSTQLMAQVASFEEGRSGDEYVPAAQELWQRVLEIEPADEVALVGRIGGLVERAPDEAIELASKALGYGHVDDRILESLVRLIDPPREVPPELREVVTGIQLDPSATAVSYGLLGALLCRCGEGTRGRMHLTIALDRGMAHPFAARAWALQRRPEDFEYAAAVDRIAVRVLAFEPGATDEPRQELLSAIAAALPDSGDPQAAFLRGVLASRCERKDEALDWFEEAYEGLPSLVEVRLHRGIAVMDKGRHDEAAQQLEHCSRRLPHDPDVQHVYAVALLAAGKVEDGLEQIQKTLGLDPDHLGANDLLERIRESGGDGDEGEAAGEDAGEGAAPAS